MSIEDNPALAEPFDGDAAAAEADDDESSLESEQPASNVTISSAAARRLADVRNEKRFTYNLHVV